MEFKLIFMSLLYVIPVIGFLIYLALRFYRAWHRGKYVYPYEAIGAYDQSRVTGWIKDYPEVALPIVKSWGCGIDKPINNVQRLELENVIEAHEKEIRRQNRRQETKDFYQKLEDAVR